MIIVDDIEIVFQEIEDDTSDFVFTEEDLERCWNEFVQRMVREGIWTEEEVMLDKNKRENL